MLLREGPLIYRRRAGATKPRKAPPAPPPAALTLVSASFDLDDFSVLLAFDRAVDAAGLDPAAITLQDGELEDARWFSRDDIAAGVIAMPSSQSISFRLIEDWYDSAAPRPLRETPGVRL